jgi:hypothetical protein
MMGLQNRRVTGPTESLYHGLRLTPDNRKLEMAMDGYGFNQDLCQLVKRRKQAVLGCSR